MDVLDCFPVRPVVAFVFWAGWTIIKTEVDAYIARSVTAELQREDGLLSVALKKRLDHLRQSEVGAINVGTFFLTPSNRSYTHYVYFPEGYKGKMFYQVKGKIIPECRYVVLSFPDAKPIPLKNSEDSIVLERYFQRSSSQARALDDIFERNNTLAGVYKSLRGITFQLEGQSTDEGIQEPSVGSGCPTTDKSAGGISSNENVFEIGYVTLVAPTIHMSN